MINKKTLFLVILFDAFLLLPSIAFGAGELCNMVKRVKDVTWQIGGTLVVVGWVIAGILYLTSMGSERMATAKKAIWAATIGTILVVISATAATIVQDAIGTGTFGSCP